jgi:hypothetical protein
MQQMLTDCGTHAQSVVATISPFSTVYLLFMFLYLFFFLCIFLNFCLCNFLMFIFCFGVWIRRALFTTNVIVIGGLDSWHLCHKSLNSNFRKHCFRVFSFLIFNLGNPALCFYFLFNLFFLKKILFLI